MARGRKKVETPKDGGPSLALLKELSKDIEDMGMVADIDEEIFVPVFFSTALNRCTGIGGWPLRRVAMIHGAESVGKSVFALGVGESMRRLGHVPVVFDTEHAAEDRWYNELTFGKGTLFKMPEHMDEVIRDVQVFLDRVRKMKEGKAATAHAMKYIGCCFVVDTLTKLIPEEAIEKMREKGVERGYSIAAMWTSMWMKSLVPQLYRLNSSMVIVVQDRENTDRKSKFDKANKPTGGKAIKYDSSLRVEVTHLKPIKVGGDKDGEIVGAQHFFTVVKNKVDGVQKAKGSFFTSNGRGDVPIGFDLVAEAVEESKVRGVAKLAKNAKDKQVVRLRVGDWRREIVGGWKTLRDKCRGDETWFGEFVDALNLDARRE